MLKDALTLSALIAAVLLVRAAFKNRVPKRLLYALWLVVLLKLCLPGTAYALPLLPGEQTAAVQQTETPAQSAPAAQQPTQAAAQPQTPAQQPASQPQEAAKPAAAMPLVTEPVLVIWFCGSALLGLWLLLTWLVFTVRLRRSRRFLGRRGRVRIYAAGSISSPCLAGLIPAVYLTEDVVQTDAAELVLRHELTHLRHLDPLWSFCRAAAVTVYWWNPFVWLAAFVSGRDAELACDEAVAAKLSPAQRVAYARAILAQAPRKAAALSLAGPPVKERIVFLTRKQRTSALCVVLALLLTVTATGCSFAELTAKGEDPEAAHQEALKSVLKTDVSLTQEQIDAVNAVFADYELSTDDTLGHFAVNGFFTSTYDDVRELNLKEFLAYFGECGEEDISEEEFAQLKDKWDDFKAERLEDFPLPIHRYPASAVEDVLKRFAGIGLADLTDMQTPFSGYTYLEDTDAFYTTTSDYNPGYFRCTSGEIEPDGDTVLLYGSTAGSLSGKAVLKLVKDGENWYIHSFTLASPEQSTVQEEQVPTTEPQSTLPIPASSMFGLTGREAVLFDAAVAQRYPRSDNDIVLPSLREYGSFEENGKTVVICDLHYDFYYDYTGPDWEWNGGAMNTYLRAELETQDGAEVCTGFEIFPGGSPSDWISGECGPLAMQNADGAWVLPEASGEWFPADVNLLQQYLEVIASTAPSSDAPAADSLSEDMIWEYVHEKLDYAHWTQEMTAEYEEIVRKFDDEDSKRSEKPGDVSQWPRYYSAFVEYFSGANADLRYLDADTIWTKGLSEDQQSLIVTMTRADVVLTLSYSLQTSQITEVSTRRNVVLQSVSGDSVTAEHITLLNASLEEDLQTLKALNIPPQNYWYGYYRVDSGELYTYKVDPNTSVTIYDIEQEYGAGEDRLYTFKTWRDFAAAAQENEGLLVQPYTLTLKNGVVVKIEEKFYN